MKSALALVVYAYTSFVGPYGPGPEIKKLYEEKCHCQVKFVDAGDSGLIWGRVQLDGPTTKAQMLLGIDSAYIFKIKSLPGWDGVQSKVFDEAPLAFIYDSEVVQNPPRSLDDLLLPEWKGEILIEDPKFTTLGLNFLFWVIKVKGEEGAWSYLKKLKSNLKVIAPSWDLAYGLFKKKRGKIVLSYATSPVYHLKEEKTGRYKAAPFDHGHYVQKEYLLWRKDADGLADYIQTKEAQEIIAQKNYMYPANKSAKLPAEFNFLINAKKLEELSEKQINQNLESWLKKWKDIF